MFGKKKKECCGGFRDLLADAGQRGLAAIVVKYGSETGFKLQSRAVAFDDKERFIAWPGGPDVVLNLSSSTGLGFCPFCGEKLAKVVARSPDHYEALAAAHRQLDD
jgi:hypothetical protein